MTTGAQLKQVLASLKSSQATLRIYSEKARHEDSFTHIQAERLNEEVMILTVGTQLEQAISGVMSAAAAMKTCALETQDQQAKKTYQDLADNLENTLQTLKDRQKYIKQQEPQFR